MTGSLAYDPEAFRSFERSGWDAVAGRYHEAFSRLTRLAVEPMLEAAGVRPGCRLLDVATGPGYAAAVARERGARVLGIDFSPPMLEEARVRFPEVEFREADAESLPFEDGDFDAVTMGFGMLHLGHPERSMAEAFRVLRPGGRFAFTVWDAPQCSATFGLVLRAIETRGRLDVPLPEGPSFFRFSDPEECRRALVGAGFASAAVRTLPLSWRVESADALLQAFLDGGVRTRALLLAQTPEGLEGIRAELRKLARPYERDGALLLSAPCVLAAGARP